MVTQANAYRQGALLFIHRLRYAFGEEDSAAHVLAVEVIHALESARSLTGQTVRCVTFPFLVAAAEARMEGEREKMLGLIPIYVDQYAPALQKRAVVFLKQIWYARDTLPEFRWPHSPTKLSAESNMFLNVEDTPLSLGSLFSTIASYASIGLTL